MFGILVPGKPLGHFEQRAIYMPATNNYVFKVSNRVKLFFSFSDTLLISFCY